MAHDHSQQHAPDHAGDMKAAYLGLVGGAILIGAILYGIVLWTNTIFAGH